MPRQLNIRSDEAFDTATRLSAHLGKSTTQVVVDALRDYSNRTHAPSVRTTPEQAASDWLILRQFIEEANRARAKDWTSDHSEFYDDNGLPR
jgi:antitoxin VapB